MRKKARMLCCASVWGKVLRIESLQWSDADFTAYIYAYARARRPYAYAHGGLTHTHTEAWRQPLIIPWVRYFLRIRTWTIGSAARADFRRLYPANAKTPTCCPSDDNRTKVTNSVTSARSLCMLPRSFRSLSVKQSLQDRTDIWRNVTI